MKKLEKNVTTDQPTRNASSAKKGGLIPQSREAIMRFEDRVKEELHKLRLAKSAFARW
jgi:hypothetical protein